MKLIYKKSFVKAYSKLSLRDKKKVDEALLLFMNDATDVNLRNHALHGKLHGKRAISAGFNLRIVFTVEGEYVTVYLLHVGTHNQVYGG